MGQHEPFQPPPATAPPKRSTADSNTSAAQPSDSATSPTTSPEACSSPEDSDRNYTPECEEPTITVLAATLGVPYQRLRRLEIGTRADPELEQRAAALLAQIEAESAADTNRSIHYSGPDLGQMTLSEPLTLRRQEPRRRS